MLGGKEIRLALKPFPQRSGETRIRTGVTMIFSPSGSLLTGTASISNGAKEEEMPS